MDYRSHLTAAVKDAVLATGIPAWDTNRHTATVRRTNRAITDLFEQAALRGLGDAVVGGYFKLSANEPHRLPRLVDSIVALRLPEVAKALVAYDQQH